MGKGIAAASSTISSSALDSKPTIWALGMILPFIVILGMVRWVYHGLPHYYELDVMRH